MRSARILLPGHPDQACDLVAEAIVDDYLRRDPESHLRISVSGGRGALFVSGDVSSKADFDVSAVVRQALGACGVMSDMEPFISLDAVAAEQSAMFRHGSSSPVSVFGYATDETPEMVPQTVAVAARIAKRLEDERQTNEKLFWVGPDAEITVFAQHASPSIISLQLEHGVEDIDQVRIDITAFIRAIAPDVSVRVNDLGPCEARGLSRRVGASGTTLAPYGFGLPSLPSCSGKDPQHAEKGGSWLVRAAARLLIQRGAHAAFVQAVYMPGEHLPVHISARDERGTDLTKNVVRDTLSLHRVMREWWRPNLNVAAAKWGMVGDPGLPWEA